MQTVADNGMSRPKMGCAPMCDAEYQERYKSTRETNKPLEEKFMMNESFGRAGYGEVSH